MNLSLDVNKLFDAAVKAIQNGTAFWVIFGLVALMMSPWIIPAISAAVAEQRTVTQKRDLQRSKIRNSISDRTTRLSSAATKK